MPTNRPRPRRRSTRPPTVRCAATGKVCYAHAAALAALVSMQRHANDRDPYRPLHVYRCAHGAHYHVGHRPLRLMRGDLLPGAPDVRTETKRD